MQKKVHPDAHNLTQRFVHDSLLQKLLEDSGLREGGIFNLFGGVGRAIALKKGGSMNVS